MSVTASEARKRLIESLQQARAGEQEHEPA